MEYKRDPQFGDHRYDLSTQEVRIVDMPITGTRHLLLFRTPDGGVSLYLSPQQLRDLKRRLRQDSRDRMAALRWRAVVGGSDIG